MSGEVETRESFFARALVPREPSRARLLIFAVLMVAWVALLIILYYTTVRPLREHSPKKAIVQASVAGRVL